MTTVLSRLRNHFANQFVGYLALFIALSSGTAYALAGHNTVYSDDIVNGEVQTADLGGGSVTPPKLDTPAKFVSAGLPDALGSCPSSPAWYDWSPDVNNSAGYYRDPTGMVHLRGVVARCSAASPIFRLPLGYRPAHREHLEGMINDSSAEAVLVYGPSSNAYEPSGWVVSASSTGDALSLDGLEFRCAPSGKNGCP